MVFLQVCEDLGTVLISLSYVPESQKLSVIILRAKDLNKGNAKEMGELGMSLAQCLGL